jgi:hypothetical protein
MSPLNEKGGNVVGRMSCGLLLVAGSCNQHDDRFWAEVLESGGKEIVERSLSLGSLFLDSLN